MPHFVLYRSMTYASKLGHALTIVKGEPFYAPPELTKELLGIGAETTEELPEDETPASAAPTDQKERDAAIQTAIETLTLRNQREDFNAGGTPHLKPLADVLGWNTNAKERDRVLARMKAGDN